jgi:arylsulfatase A-like enzyme
MLISLLGITVLSGSSGKDRVHKESLLCTDCNVIIISLSNLRKDHMGIYGYTRNTTPHIDQFFNDGILLDKAFAPASLTYTDSISLFYSLFPYTHKLMNRKDRKITGAILKSYMSLPEILRKEGYLTAAFVSDEDYEYGFGLGRTFDYYVDRSKYHHYNIHYRPGQYNIGTKDLIPPVVQWLNQNHRQKFFLFVQAYDMHCPYTPTGSFKMMFDPDYQSRIDFNDCFMTLSPLQSLEQDNKTYYPLESWFAFLDKREGRILFEDKDIQHLIALYDGELAQADANLKPLFQIIEDLKLQDHTLIILMSEHGDYLGENNYFMKAAVTAEGNLHNSNLSFPFLLKHPRYEKSVKSDQLINLVDVAPTLLNILGIDHSETKKMQGKNFVSAITEDLAVNEYAFSASIRRREYRTSGVFRLEALQNRDWKLIHEEITELDGAQVRSQRYQLFNLIKDPQEKINVLSENPEVGAQMMQILEEHRRAYTR